MRSIPDLRGMYSWETGQVCCKRTAETRRKVKADIGDDKIDREMKRFLGKIYSASATAGVTRGTRAQRRSDQRLQLQRCDRRGRRRRHDPASDVAVERSPLNRPGSEYYDVLLTFFDPNDRQGRAPLRTRFTIDVSDTVPVMIGEPVTWNEW